MDTSVPRIMRASRIGWNRGEPLPDHRAMNPGYPPRRCPMNAPRSTGAMRIALLTRTWGSSPRSQSLYTVGVLTPSLAATSRTLSRCSAPTVIPRKVGDKEGTNFLRISPFRCEGLDWVGPSVPRENEDLAAAANRWTLSGLDS